MLKMSPGIWNGLIPNSIDIGGLKIPQGIQEVPIFHIGMGCKRQNNKQILK